MFRGPWQRSSAAVGAKGQQLRRGLGGCGLGGRYLDGRYPGGRYLRRWGLVALTAGLSACTDVVPLGSWTQTQPVVPPPTISSPGPTMTTDVPVPPPAMLDAAAPNMTGTSTTLDAGRPSLDASLQSPGLDAGSAQDAGEMLPRMPACNVAGNPGPTNTAGAFFGPTETSTDWTWSAPADSIQWELMIEQEIARPTSTSPGYYWHQQFSFVQGVTGLIGLQSHGVYRPEPTAEREVTKMAVFWLSGPPLDAELGDIPYPNARIGSEYAVGLTWTTIHAKFEWEACHVYQMRFDRDSSEAGGDTWYGAWITDRDTGETTLLGRMLVPADAGQISLFSTSRTSPIELEPFTACEPWPPASAIFGAPMAVDGTSTHASHRNRFAQVARCGASRFADFPSAVRHELAVSASQ